MRAPEIGLGSSPFKWQATGLASSLILVNPDSTLSAIRIPGGARRADLRLGRRRAALILPSARSPPRAISASAPYSCG